MNINPHPKHNDVPVIGAKGVPMMLRTECIITPELKGKLDKWTAETGVHVQTLGNIIYTLGLAALSKILDDNEQRRELNQEVERIEEDRETET